MHDNHLEERLDALAAPQRDALPPASLRAAVRSARNQRLTSASLLASLILASGILVVVAMRPGGGMPVVEGGKLVIDRQHSAFEPQSIAALRLFDPFSDAEFPTPPSVPGVHIRPVRLLPMTAERMDRFLQGEL